MAGSNHRPSDYESDALTTELNGHFPPGGINKNYTNLSIMPTTIIVSCVSDHSQFNRYHFFMWKKKQKNPWLQKRPGAVKSRWNKTDQWQDPETDESF